MLKKSNTGKCGPPLKAPGELYYVRIILLIPNATNKFAVPDGVRSFRENRQVMRFAKIGKYNQLRGSTGSHTRPRRNSKRGASCDKTAKFKIPICDLDRL